MAICITELNQDCTLVEIALNKDENSVPCITYVSDGSCDFQHIEGEVANYRGVLVHLMSFFIREKNIRSLARAVCLRLYYCLSGGKGMNVGEAMISFCTHPIRLPAEVSIYVDSDIPVLFSGRFCSATTNNPANKGEFFDHRSLMFPYDCPANKEDLKVIDMREKQIEQMRKDPIEKKLTSKEKTKEDIFKSFLERLHRLPCKAKKDEEPAKPMKASDRIKALFEADRARREKDPELGKGRMRREKATINARNRIRELIRIDLESRKLIKVIKEDKKTEKNEIILEEPKFEDKKEEKLFEGFSKEDCFKGFDAFKENLSVEFKARLKKCKVEKNEIIIEDEKKEEDKKQDEKIDKNEITFGRKSLAESIYNESSKKSKDRNSISKFTLGSDDKYKLKHIEIIRAAR